VKHVLKTTCQRDHLISETTLYCLLSIVSACLQRQHQQRTQCVYSVCLSVDGPKVVH